ncbi:copper amine oxidase N-terminal domain-containing protein [Calditerricola satsumensis]|uniref:copper amine oxidase N-terminal domain-containing protein n=1 Tax=Calditerricola satsumensis TaxID=373054 RepID=UPI0006D02FF8|nr:copper amine oxidase N-terminal domain-containing protein [Calditerricola satsumensis]
MLKAARDVLKEMKEEEAREETREALLERVQALQSLAQLFAENNDWQAAIEAQEKLVRVKKADEQAFAFLGRLYQKAGKKGIKTFVNGEPVSFDVPPVIENGRTLVPIRAVAESLKAKVQWIEKTKTVIIERDGVVVKLTINQRVAIVNGRKVMLDVPATIRGGRTIVPMRFISEALGAKVEWIQEGRSSS